VRPAGGQESAVRGGGMVLHHHPLVAVEIEEISDPPAHVVDVDLVSTIRPAAALVLKAGDLLPCARIPDLQRLVLADGNQSFPVRRVREPTHCSEVPQPMSPQPGYRSGRHWVAKRVSRSRRLCTSDWNE